ncbi:MAG: hypothetical protein AAFQ68_20395 [Bacteroidota bacterium]
MRKKSKRKPFQGKKPPIIKLSKKDSISKKASLEKEWVSLKTLQELESAFINADSKKQFPLGAICMIFQIKQRDVKTFLLKKGLIHPNQIVSKINMKDLNLVLREMPKVDHKANQERLQHIGFTNYHFLTSVWTVRK